MVRACETCGGPLTTRKQTRYCCGSCASTAVHHAARARDKAAVLKVIRDYRGLPLGVWDVSDELGRLKKGRVRELLEELAAEGELLASTWEFGERLYRDARRDEAAA